MKKWIILILLINTTMTLFSRSFTPSKELVQFKDGIGGVRTIPDEVIEQYGYEYTFSESDVFGIIPGTAEGDKIITYDYSGLKYLFFSSNTRDKFFLYFWEITENKFIESLGIQFGMNYSYIVKKIGEGYMNDENLIGYYFSDGELFFKFENKSLIKIYWSFADDM